MAEGEVTFKSLLFVPVSQKTEDFQKYGSTDELIKLYVRRVFITDDFKDMMPSYLSFVRGLFVCLDLCTMLNLLLISLLVTKYQNPIMYELSNLLFTYFSLRFAI